MPNVYEAKGTSLEGTREGTPFKVIQAPQKDYWPAIWATITPGDLGAFRAKQKSSGH